MLVVIGPGTAAVNLQTDGAVSHVGVALSFAFVILAGLRVRSHLGGPLQSRSDGGLLAERAFSRSRGRPLHGRAQLTGATAGALLVLLLLGADASAAATVPSIPVTGVFILEIVLTFFLMLVVMAVATDHRVASPAAGLAVGLTVGFDAMMEVPDQREHESSEDVRPGRRDRGLDRAPALLDRAIGGGRVAVLTYGYLRKGEAHDYRGEPTASRADSVHRQLGPEPDGRGHPEPEGTGALRR